MRIASTKWSFVVMAGVFSMACLAVPAVAQPVSVPSPTVIGPIPSPGEPGNDPDHNYTFFTPMFDLADYGYVEEEFFIEGTASRYDTSEGRGRSSPAATPTRRASSCAGPSTPRSSTAS